MTLTLCKEQVVLSGILLLILFGRKSGKTTVKEVAGPCVPPRDPIGPCLPPLAPRLVWPFDSSIVVPTGTTSQAVLQGILNSAPDGTTVFLANNEIVLTSPLDIVSSISLVGSVRGTRLRQPGVGVPCVRILGAAANVQLTRLQFVSLDNVAGACCVDVNPTGGGECVMVQCNFEASVCAIVVQNGSAIDVSESTFAPILTAPASPLDYVVFNGGAGASSLFNNVWSTKMNGASPVTRLAVRRTGAFSNFVLQLVDNVTVGSIESPWLGVYEVEQESANVPKSQAVQIRSCNFRYSRNGLMLFRDADVSPANYDFLVVFNSSTQFLRPVGNLDFYLQLINFTSTNVANPWSVEKPIVYVAESFQTNAPFQDPQYVSVSSATVSALMLRDTAAFPVPDPTFVTVSQGGCQ